VASRAAVAGSSMRSGTPPRSAQDSPTAPAAFAPAAPDQASTPEQPTDAAATRQARADRAARRMILKAAAGLLSGPGGLAACGASPCTPTAP
jgi:hypothetical protein